jgi:hypothetical protein
VLDEMGPLSPRPTRWLPILDPFQKSAKALGLGWGLASSVLLRSKVSALMLVARVQIPGLRSRTCRTVEIEKKRVVVELGA